MPPHLIVASIRYHTWAVDEEDSLHKGDVLPDLRLPGDRCCFATFFAHEGVDYTGLTRVRISDYTDRNLTLVLHMQAGSE